MKTIKILLIVSIYWLLSISCKKEKETSPSDANTTVNSNTNPLDTLAYVVINLNGMKNTNGKINVALYNSEQSFNNPDQAYKELFLPTTGGFMIVRLDSLPAGTYAFAVFHDENENQDIDTNFLGVPKEGFAFSNNAFGSFGPPTWAQAQFTIAPKTTTTQSISLKFF